MNDQKFGFGQKIIQQGLTWCKTKESIDQPFLFLLAVVITLQRMSCRELGPADRAYKLIAKNDFHVKLQSHHAMGCFWHSRHRLAVTVMQTTPP